MVDDWKPFVMNSMQQQHRTTSTSTSHTKRRRRGPSTMAMDDTDSSSSWSDDDDDDDDGVVSIHRTSPVFPTLTFTHDDTPPEKDDASSSFSVATAELVRRIQQSQVEVVTECPMVQLPPAVAADADAGTLHDSHRSVYETTNDSSLPSPPLDPNKDEDDDDADSVDTAELVRRIRQPLNNNNDDVDDLPKIPVTGHVDHVRNGRVPPWPMGVVVVAAMERHPHIPPGLALNTNEDDDEFVLPEECDHDNDNDCILTNVPVGGNDKSQVPKQYDDDFVLPDQSEDEFVLPDQSSDDDDDDDESVIPPTVENIVHDEFVLPDPSDNSDDDDTAVPNQRHEFAVAHLPQYRTDHENRQNRGRGGMVPTSMTTYRTLSNRESPSNNKHQGTATAAAAQEVEPVSPPGGESRSSIENAAFGFSPPSSESRGHHTDAHPCNDNHVRTIQNSANANVHTGRAKRTNDTANIETTENFSHEGYVPVWGHQTVTTTNTRADHGSFAKRPKRTADPKQSLTQQHITVSNGRLVLGRDPPVGNVRKLESCDSSQKRNASMDRDLRYHYPASSEPNDPVTTHSGPFSSNHPVLPEVTHRSTVVHRPRRIRDPSARKVLVVPPKRTTTSATPFRLHAASAPTNVPTAPITVSARTSTWERNDVFGGSGVGAGSYQIQRQPNTQKKNQTEAEDASVVVVDSTQDDVDAPAKRRPAAKPRSYKKGTKTNRASGSRGGGGGGKRGKWGWKNKGKRTTTKEKGNGRQRRVTNTWAGNTDDPQLRHVGGAEMSF